MKRTSEGKTVREIFAEELAKPREMRYPPQMLTPAQAKAKKSLEAAVKAAERKARG